MWPRNSISIEERLSKLTEDISTGSFADITFDLIEQEEQQKNPKKKPEEYNGIDYLTYTEYKDGKETHYRMQI